MSVKQVFNTSAELDYPTVLPTLDLDFANSKTLDPRITFTRASGGSYTGADGYIKFAGVNEARFDHDPMTGESLGLLIEESRSNLITYSEQFNDAGWAKVDAGITTNTSATTAPDGSNNAEKLVENTSNSTHLVYAGSSALTAGQSYVISVYVKAAERTFASIGSVTSSSGTGINLSTGALVNVNVPGWTTASTRSVINIGNGWYRVTVTVSSATGNNSLFDSIRIFTNNGTTTTYTGDGTSGIYIWGAQLEAGPFPTSYIPTAGSTVTRTADNASMSGENFSSWHNQSEGTVYIRSYANNPSGVMFSIESGNSSINNSILLGATPSNLTFRVRGASATTQASFTLASAGEFSFFKNYIGTYSTNSFNASVNGVISGSDDVDGIPPNIQNNLKIGYNASPNTTINGTISRLTYYPKRLPNAQLQALTK
jgi:hypothetical protein